MRGEERRGRLIWRTVSEAGIVGHERQADLTGLSPRQTLEFKSNSRNQHLWTKSLASAE